MNNYLILIFTSLFSLLVFPTNAKLVTHSFKYHLAVSGEVFFVWGGEKWKVAPLELRPAGTLINNGIMHSPMKQQGHYYSIDIIAHENSEINYGFCIKTETPDFPHDYIWTGEYSTIARDSVSEIVPQITTIEQVGKVMNFSEIINFSNDSALITTTIKYHFPKAADVDLVWGINGWSSVPEALRPKGSFVQNNIMRIPMKNVKGTFITTLTVPKGAVLNYGYMINKIKFSFEECQYWDEKEDFPITRSNSEIMDMPSEQAIIYVNRPQAFPNIAKNSFYILSAFILIYLIFKYLIIKKFFKNQNSFLHSGKAWTVSLAVFLILIRANAAGIKYDVDTSYSLLTLDVFKASVYDVFYITLLYILFYVIHVFFKNRIFLSKIMNGSFIFLCFFSLVVGVFNIKAVEMLGTPFNYQWLYYSDFLGSVDARNAFTSNINFELIVNILALCVSLYILKEITQSVWNSLHTNKYKKILSYAFPGSMVVFYAFSYLTIDQSFKDKGKLQNPIMAFLSSMIDTNLNPDILSFEVTKEYNQEFEEGKIKRVEQIDSARIKNVVLFVMESVSAKYLNLYGSNYKATPVLSSYFNQSLVFENAYAHAPSTNISMVSLLAGIYPWISYKSITKEHTNIDHPTLSSELQKQGFRTSFFTSADNDFQNVGSYLSFRDFDVVSDFKNGTCASNQLIVKENPWENSDGADDECIVNDFKKWVSDDKSKPFFSVLWTYQTHYPYFLTSEKEVDYKVDNPEFNKYLNALNHTDAVIGKLLKFLEESNIMDSTLVVIVADHGEAFGQHGQTGHASKLYEENIHVPLIFINPVLFKGTRNPVIAGHIDIAPTIFNMLNLQPAKEWQGESLLNRERIPRTYFYAPWSDFLFGYRDDKIKFIYNATSNSHEIYDLEFDPDEKKNVVNTKKDYENEGRKRLAAWVQYQDKYMKQAFEKSKPKP